MVVNVLNITETLTEAIQHSIWEHVSHINVISAATKS